MQSSSSARLRVAALLVGVAALNLLSPSREASAATAGNYSDIDYDLSGVVTESDTHAPVEGAYVAITYRHPGDSPNPRYGRNGECIKVKGAYTDKKGRFRFEAEHLDGLVMQFVRATKRDHYVSTVNSPAATRHEPVTASRSDLRIELVKRLPLIHGMGDPRVRDLDREYALVNSSPYALDCWRARTREDASQAIPFLRILQREAVKHRGDVEAFWDIERIVYLREAWPASTGQVGK
jgi:hypothetical protein